MGTPRWQVALPWLCKKKHSTTAEQAAELIGYIKANAQCLKEKGSNSALPLHYAVGFQKGEHAATIVMALIEASPRAAEHTTDNGFLPLHYAAGWQRGEHSAAVVEALLAAYPAAVKQMVAKVGNWLPLHYAAHYQKGMHAPDVVAVLLKAYPHATRGKTADQALPLYKAVIAQSGQYGLAVISLLLKADPDSARKWKGDFLPLHSAINYQKGEYAAAVIAELLKAYPLGAQQKDPLGRLPLHFAAQSQTGEYGVTMVTALLRAFPQAAKQKDDSGLLPLHFAARNQKGKHGAAVLRALLRAYPGGIRETSEGGYLPLHDATQSPSDDDDGAHSFAVVMELLPAFPGAAQVESHSGLLPLHHAAAYQSGQYGAAMIKAVYMAYPPAAQHRATSNRLLPLHMAAENENGAAIVEALLNLYPQAAQQRNIFGELPVHVANQHLPAACVQQLQDAANDMYTPYSPSVEQPLQLPSSPLAALAAVTPEKEPVPSTADAPTLQADTSLAPKAEAVSAVADHLASSSTFPSFIKGHFSHRSTEPIGSGTHKIVHSASYEGPAIGTLKTGADVALLYFKAGIAPSLHEYKVMSAARGLHLATFYGTIQPGPKDTGLCLVSDLARLGSLPDFFEKAEDDGVDVSLSHKLVIAQQAGLGLSTLHAHNYVHADVAARNVLVYVFDATNHNLTHVKLSDYGLVRERSKYTDASGVDGAVDSSQPLSLPPKWASLESLKKDKFYHSSDVWSFAVLIWEVLTECDQPYPDVADKISTMTGHLLKGHRLPQPKECTDVLWKVMSQCWHEKRNDRPQLRNILEAIADTLHDVAAAETAAAVAAAAAQLTVAEAELAAMKEAEQAWHRPGFGWRADGIDLCPDLDRQLTYRFAGRTACADPRDASDGLLGDQFADAIERLVMERGGSKGGRFKANVDAITICKNQRLITSFNERLARLHVQRQDNVGTNLFNARWDDPHLSAENLDEKQAVFTRLERLFVETDMTGPGPGSKVALMWHGVPSSAVADAVCSTGLSARVSGNDEGYFGKGVYLTPEAEYAAFYANGQSPPKRGKTYTLILCAVCVANPYPLTRGVDYTDDMCRFHYNYGDSVGTQGTAKALYKGFDAHFVAINTGEFWQAATNVVRADFHELVVSSEEQVLPFAQVVVKIK